MREQAKLTHAHVLTPKRLIFHKTLNNTGYNQHKNARKKLIVYNGTVGVSRKVLESTNWRYCIAGDDDGFYNDNVGPVMRRLSISTFRAETADPWPTAQMMSFGDITIRNWERS